jgi:hypothetical protein
VYLATKKWLAELYIESDPETLEHIAVTRNGYWGRAHQTALGILVKRRGEEKGCPIMTRTHFIEVGFQVNMARPHIHKELGIGYRKRLALAGPANGQAG